MAGGAIQNNRHFSGSLDERADPRPDDSGFFHLFFASEAVQPARMGRGYQEMG